MHRIVRIASRSKTAETPSPVAPAPQGLVVRECSRGDYPVLHALLTLASPGYAGTPAELEASDAARGEPALCGGTGAGSEPTGPHPTL